MLVSVQKRFGPDFPRGFFLPDAGPDQPAWPLEPIKLQHTLSLFIHYPDSGARLAALLEDFRFASPAPIGVRYTAIGLTQADTRAALFARLDETEPILAHA